MFFEVTGRSGPARAGRIETSHGTVETPCFMPVGTYGTVKAMDPALLEELGFGLILSNSYHLSLSPGMELVRGMGGLHEFMGWNGAILTDSGGFQVFSLKELLRVTDEGVESRSPLDGSKRFLTPESVVETEVGLGVDIAMVLDHCPPSDAPRRQVEEAMARTTAWARRSLQVSRPDQTALFGIVQGGQSLDLRKRHIEEICGLDFDGFALGGFSVGEPPEVMHELVAALAPSMPADRPRYLMGVGRPIDIVLAVASGVDMFDCVIPTRHARNGQLFTSAGPINVANARFRTESGPPDPLCDCPTCRRFSMAYLSHLYRRHEILYSILSTTHNLAFYKKLMERLRLAVMEDRMASFVEEFLRKENSAR